MPEGYSTLTRDVYPDALQKEKFFWSSRDFPSGGSSSSTFPGRYIQTTYSYRTNKSGLDGTEDASVDDGVLNEAGVFASLKKEYDAGPKSSFDTGHEFWTEKYGFSRSAKRTRCFNTSGPGDQWYDGPIFMDSFVPSSWGGQWPGLPYTYTSNNAKVDGTSAINATVPNKTIAQLNVGLAELYREGIPHVIGGTLRQFKEFISNPLAAIGDEHLNYQFGWLPLASDVRAACNAVLNSAKLLRQYERDSGRNVRRRFRFPDVTDTTYETRNLAVNTEMIPLICQNMFVSMGSPGSRVLSTTLKRSFAGAYTYHFAVADHQRNALIDFERKANHLLGLDLTAEVLWNLAPWSWLSDWRLNIGKILGNQAAFDSDSLVMRYGYLTVKREAHDSRMMLPLTMTSGKRIAVTGFDSFHTRTERFRATPYGFGLNTSSFTGKQWSILSALGMTKAPNILH